jgi:hypothetical protein
MVDSQGERKEKGKEGSWWETPSMQWQVKAYNHI